MPCESTCYAPTRTVLKIGRTRDEIFSADSVLNDFRATRSLHFLCTQVISQLLAKTVLIKIVRLLVKKNTVFAKYLPSRIFK